jgi:hypothetical protein
MWHDESMGWGSPPEFVHSVCRWSNALPNGVFAHFIEEFEKVLDGVLKPIRQNELAKGL